MAWSPITWLYSLILLAGILLIFGSLLWWFSHPHSFLIKQITISGQQYSSTAAIKNTIAPYLSNKIWQIPLSELELKLIALPYVKSASLQIIWPQELQVQISEYQAVAVWANKPYTYVDVSGELFTLAGVDLALPQFVADADCLSELSGKQAQIQAILQEQVHSIFCDKLGSWSLVLNNGMQLNLGRGEIIPRLHRFIKIYHQVLVQLPAKSYIDLRYPNGIAVRSPGRL